MQLFNLGIFLQSVLFWARFLTLFALAILAIGAAYKARGRIPLILGLVFLAGLFVPTAMVTVDVPYPIPSWLMDAFKLALYIFLLLSLFIAAILLSFGISKDSGQQALSRWYPSACLLLGVAILVKIMHNVYWMIVWDGTTDSLDFFWIILPIASAVVAGAGLITGLPKWRRLAGLLFLLAVPAGIFLVYQAAKQVDFRTLTRQRAALVAAAVDAYHTRQGSYPNTLWQLPLWQRLTLPGPVIFYGADWCYLGGKDYYRLGYLDREHWSSPIIFGQVASYKGYSPLKVDVCQPAIDDYRARNPGWDAALQEYGKPTPTPDVGD